MDVLNRGPTSMEPDGERTTPTPENVRFRVGYAFPSIKCLRLWTRLSMPIPSPQRASSSRAWVQTLHSRGRADNQRPLVSGGFTRATRLDVRRQRHRVAWVETGGFPVAGGWVLCGVDLLRILGVLIIGYES